MVEARDARGELFGIGAEVGLEIRGVARGCAEIVYVDNQFDQAAIAGHDGDAEAAKRINDVLALHNAGSAAAHIRGHHGNRERAGDGLLAIENFDGNCERRVSLSSEGMVDGVAGAACGIAEVPSVGERRAADVGNVGSERHSAAGAGGAGKCIDRTH